MDQIALPALRVLIFDHTAALGGGEIALLNLIRYLNPREVKPVVVLGASGPLVLLLEPLAETFVLPLPSAIKDTKKNTLGLAALLRVREIVGVLAYSWRLSRFIREQAIELVHTNSLKADIIGGIAARLAMRPVIWHVRDRIESDYLPQQAVSLFRFLCRVIPTYVIANSAATLRSIYGNANVAENSNTENIAGKSSGVVHDGTILPAVPDAIPMTTELTRIGLIGRISPWKGQHIFLQAAAQVIPRFPNARFFIVGAPLFGEEGYGQELRELSKRLKLEDVVEFTGFRGDIENVIAELDLMVHASTSGEPFGQVIIEAMAASKPVIATNGGGVPEIVQDGKTGILVPMGEAQAMADAMVQLLADPARAREMGIQGRLRVANHFTMELTASKVESVYREVMRLRGRGQAMSSR